MKIIEVIYILWPLWIFATLALICITWIKSFGQSISAMAAATGGIHSDSMKRHEKEDRVLSRLIGAILVMLLLLSIAMIYHCYLYIFKWPFHLPL
jgi:hypothetical protein